MFQELWAIIGVQIQFIVSVFKTWTQSEKVLGSILQGLQHLALFNSLSSQTRYLGAEKSLVRKLCNGIYVINSPNMQCLQILGNKTFLLSVETGTEAGTSGWHPYARWVGDRARPTERLTLTGHSPAPNRLCPTRALSQSLRHCVCKLPSGVTFRFIDLFR